MRIGKRERRLLAEKVHARRAVEARIAGIGHPSTQYQMRSAWTNFWPVSVKPRAAWEYKGRIASVTHRRNKVRIIK